VTGTIKVPARPQAIAANDNDVWVVSLDVDTLLHIDAKTGRRDKRPFLIGNAPASVAIDERTGNVWVVNSKEDRIARLER
jgi:DNA-binding beta-propeller fold protein YncE